MRIRKTPVRTVAPTSLPVTLADVKTLLRLDGAEFDVMLTQYMKAATEAAEKYTKRAFITQTWKVSLDAQPSAYMDNIPPGTYELPTTLLFGDLPKTLLLPMEPIQSITSVKTYDNNNTETVMSAAGYYLDTIGSRLVLNQTTSWPSNMRNIASAIVEYVAGYGTSDAVPDGIKQAIKEMVKALYDGCTMDQAMSGLAKSLLDGFKIYGE